MFFRALTFYFELLNGVFSSVSGLKYRLENFGLRAILKKRVILGGTTKKTSFRAPKASKCMRRVWILIGLTFLNITATKGGKEPF